MACEKGRAVLAAGGGALEAVVAATAVLEDDPRFNAGTGSNLRLDGTTIEMDAACMSSSGELGAVAVIEAVKNPVRVARRVLDSPHILLAGAGATAFARQCGFAAYDPVTPGARARLAQILAVKDLLGEWSLAALRAAWNFETPLARVLGGDTVGAVAFDGEAFATALSTGGTTAVLRGRVGDAPLPGCGLYAGPAGAIAATGDGEYIARNLLAFRAYQQLESGRSPEETANWALHQLAENIDLGIIVVNASGFAGAARHGMAWYGLESNYDGLRSRSV
ncbi:MAG TPA: isoaspartyl peptidase/L-asparaginase [Candidatus Obscuribacterales bacterium]